MIKEKGTTEEGLIDTRDVYFEGEFLKTPTYDRSKLKLDAQLKGPAIIEEVNSTTVIPPGASAVVDKNSTTVIPPEASAVVDKYGNIIIDVQEG
jgi:N-methylhydantoinase A